MDYFFVAGRSRGHKGRWECPEPPRKRKTPQKTHENCEFWCQGDDCPAPLEFGARVILCASVAVVAGAILFGTYYVYRLLYPLPTPKDAGGEDEDEQRNLEKENKI